MKTIPFFRTLLLALLLAAGGTFVNRAYAQYQSFFGDSITEYSIGGNYVAYDPNFFAVNSYSFSWTKSDTTTINGNLYFSIEDPYSLWEYATIYLREDTAYGRVYRYNSWYDLEQLTCDMSLSVGDTFVFPYSPRWFGIVDNPEIGVVDSVWFYNGRKIIHLRGNLMFISDLVTSILFIEGIGPTYSTFGWGDGAVDCPGKDWDYPFILCVHKDDELVYMADERAGCVQHGPASVRENVTPVFTLNPNPVRNSLNIKFENASFQRGKLYITDMVGRVVYTQEVEEDHLKINIKNLESGLYIVTWLSSGKKHSEKFIKK